MRKLWFVFGVMLILSCTQNQAQNDFYGTWVNQDNDTSLDAKMEYTITASTFTAIYTDNSPWSPRRTVFEIFSWEKIANEDAASKGDYPSGFLLGLRSEQGNNTAKLFIHRNKNSLISAYEYNGRYRKDIYIKQ